MWNLAYDGGYGAGAAVFGLICVRTGFPAAFALTGALILATVPVALRERKAGPRPGSGDQRGSTEASCGSG